MSKTLRCKKCKTEKGKPHRSGCVAARYPSWYPDSTVYMWLSDTSSGSGGSSSYGTGSSSSSDSSGGGGGGGCE